MSGNGQTVRDRSGEAAQDVYSGDVAALNALVDRLTRSPAASVTDKALLGRIRASARLLNQPKRLKDYTRRCRERSGATASHLGRGCPDD